ncbi:MAG: formate dehydrogenase, gamma subunit [Verrucomicrobia bacterium]|nr:formate dehydrogenase, gamma subunit [Verrucomicrobiota bacterium]
MPAAGDEIPRHPAYIRLLHWSMAAVYIPVMATGMGLYWNKILGWILPLFGGKETSINIHFWGGLGMAGLTLLMFLAWRAVSRWTGADTQFVRDLPQHALHPGRPLPADTGFFNGGQKLYFWAVVGTGVLFVVTGLVWWFRKDVPANVYAVCRTTHRILGVTMTAGFFVHVYKGTFGEPGTLRSMIRGTVTAKWAQERRPGWYKGRG